MFAYPPPVTTETKDTGAKVPTAVLSTTAKAKDKAKKKEAEKAVKEGQTTADDLKEGADKPEGTLQLLLLLVPCTQPDCPLLRHWYCRSGLCMLS